MVKLAVIGNNAVRFSARLNMTNFGIMGNVVIQPGSYGKLGQLEVGKQQVIAFGSTGMKGGGAEGEPIFIDLRSSTDAVLDGVVRLAYYDANDRLLDVILEERTERLRSDANDRNKARLLTEWARACPEDCYLRIEFYPDSASAVTFAYNATNASILVPVTKSYL